MSPDSEVDGFRRRMQQSVPDAPDGPEPIVIIPTNKLNKTGSDFSALDIASQLASSFDSAYFSQRSAYLSEFVDEKSKKKSNKKESWRRRSQERRESCDVQKVPAKEKDISDRDSIDIFNDVNVCLIFQGDFEDHVNNDME